MSRVSFTLTEQERGWLRKLAERDMRDNSRELGFLIRQEAIRRRIDGAATGSAAPTKRAVPLEAVGEEEAEF